MSLSQYGTYKQVKSKIHLGIVVVTKEKTVES